MSGWDAYQTDPDEGAEGPVLRTVLGPGRVVGGAWIAQAEIYADGVRIFWRDTAPPPREVPVAVGERDHPHFSVADDDGQRFLNRRGGWSRHATDAGWSEEGTCVATPAPAPTATEIRLTDGVRVLTLRLR